MQTYKAIINQDKINKEDLNLKRNEHFLKKRPHVVTYLKKLCDNYEYTTQTYYLALHFIDKILSFNTKLKFDLVTIGCFLLSSNKLILN
jgi:hypothetical protein